MTNEEWAQAWSNPTLHDKVAGALRVWCQTVDVEDPATLNHDDRLKIRQRIVARFDQNLLDLFDAVLTNAAVAPDPLLASDAAYITAVDTEVTRKWIPIG